MRARDRALVGEMLKMDKYIDMLIPRGGAGLHKLCREQSTIPVITGGIGVCHIYIDHSADVAEALKIIVNAKVQRRAPVTRSKRCWCIRISPNASCPR